MSGAIKYVGRDISNLSAKIKWQNMEIGNGNYELVVSMDSWHVLVCATCAYVEWCIQYLNLLSIFRYV